MQWDPVALKTTVARLLEAAPTAMYLTHYGRVGRDAADVQRLGANMLTLADGMTRIALALRESPERHRLLKSELLALYLADLVQHQGPSTPTAPPNGWRWMWS